MSLESQRRITDGQIGTTAAARILEWMNVETGASVVLYNGTGTDGEHKGVWAAGFYNGLNAVFGKGIYADVTTGAGPTGVIIGYS